MHLIRETKYFKVTLHNIIQWYEGKRGEMEKREGEEEEEEEEGKRERIGEGSQGREEDS